MAKENNTNTNTSTSTSTPNTENAPPQLRRLTEPERLKLIHELAVVLSEFTQDDRRHVLTAVAQALGVASQRPQQQQQRRAGGRS